MSARAVPKDGLKNSYTHRKVGDREKQASSSLVSHDIHELYLQALITCQVMLSVIFN